MDTYCPKNGHILSKKWTHLRNCILINNKKYKKYKKYKKEKIEKNMTVEETQKLLGLLKSEYQFSYNKMTADQKQKKLEMWYSVLKNIPLEVATAAVNSLVMEPRTFAPQIGEVTNRIVELVSDESEVDALNAWDQVRRFIHRYPQEEYEKHYMELPELVRDVVRIPDLIGYARNTSDQNQNFEKPRFLIQYKQIKSAWKRNMLASGNLKAIANPQKLQALGFTDIRKIGDK